MKKLLITLLAGITLSSCTGTSSPFNWTSATINGQPLTDTFACMLTLTTGNTYTCSMKVAIKGLTPQGHLALDKVPFGTPYQVAQTGSGCTKSESDPTCNYVFSYTGEGTLPESAITTLNVMNESSTQILTNIIIGVSSN